MTREKEVVYPEWMHTGASSLSRFVNQKPASRPRHALPFRGGVADWAGPYAFIALLLAVVGTLNLGLFPGAVMKFAQHSSLLLN